MGNRQRAEAQRVLGDVARQVNGKGGGRPDMAQGGGPDGSKANQALQAIEAALAEAK